MITAHKISMLNDRARHVATFDPYIFLRLQECIVNAKTDLSKIRLISTAATLGIWVGINGIALP